MPEDRVFKHVERALLADIGSNQPTEPYHLRVSTLLKPPQMVTLESLYPDSLQPDVYALLNSRIGTATHRYLEEGLKLTSDLLLERRLYAEVEGLILTGQIDFLDWDGQKLRVLGDFKIVSAYAKRIDAWAQQLNIYDYLVLRQYGVRARRLVVVAIYRDWSRHAAAKNRAYPQHPVEIVDLESWPAEQIEDFLKDRIDAHMSAWAAGQIGEPIRPCTDEERWMNQKFRVTRPGAKRAAATFDSMVDAKQFLARARNKDELVIESTAPVPRRCLGWCNASNICPQYQAELKGEEKHVVPDDDD